MSLTTLAWLAITALGLLLWLVRRRRTYPERPSRITRRWLHEHSYDREGDEP